MHKPGVREYHRASLIAAWSNPETRAKIQGENHHGYGKPRPDMIGDFNPMCDEEIRKRHQAAVKKSHNKPEYLEKVSGSNHYRAKSVETLAKGESDWKPFNTISAAASHIGIRPTEVKRVADGVRRHTHGYKVRYIDRE